MQREQRLVFVYGLTHSGRTDRPQSAAAVHQLEVRIDGRRLVESRPVRRAVEVEDRARRVRDLLRHRLDTLAELFLGLFAMCVPRGVVRPAG